MGKRRQKDEVAKRALSSKCCHRFVSLAILDWAPRNDALPVEGRSMKSMMGVVLGMASLAMVTGAFAAEPMHNVSGKRHPNLAAAQRLSDQAYHKILDAQRANEWDLGGHAQHAKDLLEQVNAELKQAAETANHK
jgi:hypothetical protein